MRLNKVSLASVLLATCSSLCAQEAETAADPAEAVELETIVVTGEKMSRTLADTTTSTSVFSGADIEAQGDRTLGETLRRAANVATAEEGQFSIRGVSREGATGRGAPLISVQLDGVTLDRYSQQAADDLFDVDQVEVLRGPQSTSQGRNALAGAVVLNTRDPRPVWDAHARGQAGDYGIRRLAFAGGGPVVESLSFRIVASYDETDGFITHEPDGDRDFAHDRRRLVRGKLAWRPENGSAFESLLMVGASDRKGQPDFNIERGTAGTDPEQRRTSAANEDTRDRTQSLVASWRNTLELDDGWSLTAITSAMDSEQAYLRDFDGLEEDNGYNPISGRGRNLSQELRAGFDNDAGTRGIVGVYAGRFESSERVGSEDVRIAASYLVPIPVVGELAEVETDFVSNEKRDARNGAVFSEVDWALPLGLTLTTGLRYDRERLDSRNSFLTQRADAVVVANGTRQTIPLPGRTLADLLVLGGQSPDTNGLQGGRTTYDAWLPKLGLRHQIAEDWSVFGQYARAYRAGGVDVDTTNGDTLPFDPEYTQTWETGLRGALRDWSMELSANVFYTRWKDQQVNVPRGLFFVTENAGKSRLYGAEANLAWRVMRSLRLDFGLGYTDTKFLEYTTDNADYAGKQFIFAPKQTANLGATWRHPVGWTAAGNLGWRSRAYASPANEPDEISEARAVLDLRTGYDGASFGVFLVGRNVLDRDYVSETYQFRQGYVGANSPRGYAAYGAPRVVSVELEARF